MTQPRRPLLFVVSGPSGVGKDAVIQRLRESGAPLQFVVTATTREPRPGEQNGVDYWFLSRSEFAELLANDGFVEHATVYGHSYGVPRKQIRDALATGKDVIMRVDVQGAATIRRTLPGAVFIFLAASTGQELRRRLSGRQSEDAEALRRRLETAEREMEQAAEFDYVVTNEEGRLDEAAATIEAIIAAEHARVRRP